LRWLVPMVAVVHWHGWYGQFAQQRWFLSKAALLTFGGAYAVLPYVCQGSVPQAGVVRLLAGI